MAKSPNMKPTNDNWSISTSWTQPYSRVAKQPYLPHSYNPFYTQDVTVANEIARMDFLEQEIAAMTEFPLALELIKTAQGKNK